MEDRAEPAKPALDSILERLKAFISRISSQQHAEQLEFERRMTAIQKEREVRQKEKESLEMQIRGLQQRLQELNHEGVTGDSIMRQLEIERDAAAKEWETTRETLEDKISTAIASMVRLSIQSTVYLGLKST